MPTYQYACTNPECSHRFELVQSFTDPAATECPVCGFPVRKVYGSVGVVFKGSGFYRTDSRAASASAESGSSSSKDAAASNSGKKDAKGSDSTSAAKKDSAGSSAGYAGSSSSSGSSGSSSSGSGSSGKTAASA